MSLTPELYEKLLAVVRGKGHVSVGSFLRAVASGCLHVYTPSEVRPLAGVDGR